MRKANRKGKKFNGKTIGLDLHKAFIEYVVIDEKGDEIAGGNIGTDRKKLKKLLGKFGLKVQVVMEACGLFYWVHDISAEMFGKENVHVAQSSRIKAIANSHEKNDTNDAWWLAYLLYERRLPDCWVPEGDVRDLRIYTRELRTQINSRSDSLRRLRSHFAQEGIKLVGSSLNTIKARAQLSEVISNLSEARQIAVSDIIDEIEFFDLRIEASRKRIKDFTKEMLPVKMMQDVIPGIGVTLAPIIYAELGDATRFYSAKAYAKATGLTPSYRESGGKKHGGGIARAGSAQARWALTRAVVGIMRCKSGAGLVIKNWITNQRKRKPYGKVVVAAARKLAEAIWRLFTYGECFDVAKAFGG